MTPLASFNIDGARHVMWCVEDRLRPSVAQALERFDHLDRHGPSDTAFGLDQIRPAASGWIAHTSGAAA